MQIKISKQGVTFDIGLGPNDKQAAMHRTLKAANLSGVRVRDIQYVGRNLVLAVISNTKDAAMDREIFARRLQSELALCGIFAEVVA